MTSQAHHSEPGKGPSSATLKLHEGIGPELVSDPLPDPMAFDDVARLDVIR